MRHQKRRRTERQTGIWTTAADAERELLHPPTVACGWFHIPELVRAIEEDIPRITSDQSVARRWIHVLRSFGEETPDGTSSEFLRAQAEGMKVRLQEIAAKHGQIAELDKECALAICRAISRGAGRAQTEQAMTRG